MQISEPLGEKDRIFEGFEKSRNELACFNGKGRQFQFELSRNSTVFPSQDFILAN